MTFDSVALPNSDLCRYLDPVDIALASFFLREARIGDWAIEVGVLFGGWTVSAMLNSAEALKVVGVDPYSWPQGEEARAQLEENIRVHGFETRFSLVEKLSQAKFVSGLKGRVVVAHIDGEHSESSALADLLEIASLMSDDGVIVVDDWCHPMFPGVQSALHLFLQQSDWRVFTVTDRKAYLAKALRAQSIQDDLVETLLEAGTEFQWCWQHGRVPTGIRGESQRLGTPELGAVAEYEISSSVLGQRVLLMAGNRVRF